MRRATAGILCALALASCTPAGPPGPASPAEASAEYCATVMAHEESLRRALGRAYDQRDTAGHLALQLQLLDFLASNPGGCFPPGWAADRRADAERLRASVNIGA